MSSMRTLNAFLREWARGLPADGYWLSTEPKGETLTPIEGEPGSWEFVLCAFWHCCPRCYSTLPRMMGALRHCHCGKSSPGSFRSVSLVVPEKGVPGLTVGQTLGRLGSLLNGVKSAHPAEFREERTVLRIDDWGNDR